MSTCSSVTELQTARSCRPRFEAPITLSRLRWLVTATLLAVATVLLSTVTAHAAETQPPQQNSCDIGVFCAWSDEGQHGTAHFSDLRTTNMEECVPLLALGARSFVNNTNRPVTVYQEADCSSEADFSTYPTGSSVPHAPFVVRAIKIWSH